MRRFVTHCRKLAAYLGGRGKRNQPAAVSRFQPAEGCKASVNPDGLVLLDLASGFVFSGNRTAAAIWEGLVRGQSADSISRQISAALAQPADRVLGDVTEFLNELVEAGLLVGCRGQAA